MAERMNLRALMWAGLMCCGTSMHAQTLRDPTQPPATTGLARSASGVSPSAARPASVTAIRVGSEQRIAMIDGRQVKVGDVVTEGRVKAIRGHEVVLSTAQGTRVLKLYPGVNKQTHDSIAAREVARGNPAPSAPKTGDSTR